VYLGQATTAGEDKDDRMIYKQKRDDGTIFSVASLISIIVLLVFIFQREKCSDHGCQPSDQLGSDSVQLLSIDHSIA
jgi:hypothetical protein